MTNLSSILSAITPGINSVRRTLEVLNQAEGLKPIGTRLNRSALTRSITAVHGGYVNNDRFKRSYAAPDVSAGFSFVIDMSDSMRYRQYVDGKETTWWEECCGLTHSITHACQRIGVKSAVAGCLFDCNYRSDGPSGASTPATPIILTAKTPEDRWTDTHYEKMRKVQPTGGTNLICYAEAALSLARSMNATHRLAFFLTDGECSSKDYLESLRLQAQAQGIKLVGIGLGTNGNHLPNGVSAPSAVEVGRKMMAHIEQVIKSREGIEANDN